VGEKQNQPFQLSFNPSLRVDFQGSRVTSDSGLLLVRELDERLGLSSLDLRLGKRGIGPKHHFLPRLLLALDLWQKHFVPVLGTVHVARSQLCSQTVSLPERGSRPSR
jgi:hypothetical protein